MTKIALRTIDPAIRRRLNLIPFIVNIPEAEQDKELFDKLKAEWPGILQWAVEGCLEWQRIGLAAPPCVSDATQRYLEGEDSVQAWLDDCCTIGPNLTAAKADVRNSWTKWCERTRTPPGGRNEFTDKRAERLRERQRNGRKALLPRLRHPARRPVRTLLEPVTVA